MSDLSGKFGSSGAAVEAGLPHLFDVRRAVDAGPAPSSSPSLLLGLAGASVDLSSYQDSGV